MERKKASDFDPQLLGLLDKYVHGGINRRQFLDGAAKFAVGGLTYPFPVFVLRTKTSRPKLPQKFLFAGELSTNLLYLPIDGLCQVGISHRDRGVAGRTLQENLLVD